MPVLQVLVLALALELVLQPVWVPVQALVLPLVRML
jgi:hypothetical protein